MGPSGLNRYFFKNIMFFGYVLRFLEEHKALCFSGFPEERKLGYVPQFPKEHKFLCFSVPHGRET
jgi:hypothetical protein